MEGKFVGLILSRASESEVSDEPSHTPLLLKAKIPGSQVHAGAFLKAFVCRTVNGESL